MFVVGHIDLVLMLVLGLASSLHCATMCGPIICVASAPLVSAPVCHRRLLSYQLWYHLGRGATYGLLGALLAMAGQALTSLFPARGVGGILQVAMGLAMMGLGIWQLVRNRTVGAAGNGWLTRALRALMVSGHGRGMAALGLLTGFLPCGVLYAALARAVAAEGPAQGALVMLAFWLGTVPLLASMGLAAGGFARLVGRRALPVLVSAMLITGGWLTAKGWRNIGTSQVLFSGGVGGIHQPSCPLHGRNPQLRQP
jgi:uncharacterized protein